MTWVLSAFVPVLVRGGTKTMLPVTLLQVSPPVASLAATVVGLLLELLLQAEAKMVNKTSGPMSLILRRRTTTILPRFRWMEPAPSARASL